jgi:hypothetical protein
MSNIAPRVADHANNRKSPTQSQVQEQKAFTIF